MKKTVRSKKSLSLKSKPHSKNKYIPPKVDVRKIQLGVWTGSY